MQTYFRLSLLSTEKKRSNSRKYICVRRLDFPGITPYHFRKFGMETFKTTSFDLSKKNIKKKEKERKFYRELLQ